MILLVRPDQIVAVHVRLQKENGVGDAAEKQRDLRPEKGARIPHDQRRESGEPASEKTVCAQRLQLIFSTETAVP